MDRVHTIVLQKNPTQDLVEWHEVQNIDIWYVYVFLYGLGYLVIKSTSIQLRSSGPVKIKMN